MSGSAAKNGLSKIRNVATEGLRWRLVDARGEVVGRLAAQVSRVLQGKDKPTYRPGEDNGDVVVVVNAQDVEFTRNKMRDKVYYKHTGYPGGLRSRTAKEWMERDPTFVLRKAVERMLPKNLTRKDRMRKLRIFADEEHGLEADTLVPLEMPPRLLKNRKGAEYDTQLPVPWATPLNREAFARRTRTRQRQPIPRFSPEDDSEHLRKLMGDVPAPEGWEGAWPPRETDK
mmetsp:Transcript_4702/g.16244  ORF Transcript_4702/g.16244 Transcript_4702/m.16244 type:complete len:229 (+) Transcript_4702:82-768(+)